MKLLIPHSLEHLGGPFAIVEESQFTVLARREKVVIVELLSTPEGIGWGAEAFHKLYCQIQHDGSTIKAIREVTPEDSRQYRVAVWIQDEEIPECCGRPMFFVGQIDDDGICAECPEDAKRWWHDAASFYVFTCGQCLKCAAVGQQF